MRFYHGTTSNYVQSILKEGLQVKPEQRWQVTLCNNFNPYESERGDHYIYLAEEMGKAEKYARMRAKYLKAPRASHIEMEDLYGGMDKAGDAPVVHNVHPVVLALDLPDYWPIEEDPHDWNAYRTPRAIPAQYIHRLNAHRESLAA